MSLDGEPPLDRADEAVKGAEQQVLTWRLRPSVYKRFAGSQGPENAVLPFHVLMDGYVADGRRASVQWMAEASSDADAATASARWILPKAHGLLRCAQWNLHYFDAPWVDDSQDDDDYVNAVISELRGPRGADADVIVINEFGYHGRCASGCAFGCRRSSMLGEELEALGYTIRVAPGTFPTAIATRLPVLEVESYRLDEGRSVVHHTVAVETPTGEAKEVSIFGTHLDDSDVNHGIMRLNEAKELLRRIQDRAKGEPLLVVGDFNQQRRQDYLESEWRLITQSKRARNSPVDDGVAEVLSRDGFRCCYDQEPVSTNWIVGDPPPATHWSSTVVDYSYSRGSIVLSNMFVCPSNLSDHRMVVCDWRIT